MWEEALWPAITADQQIGIDQQVLFVAKNRRQVLLRHVISWLSRHRFGQPVIDRLLRSEADARTGDVVVPALDAEDHTLAA